MKRAMIIAINTMLVVVIALIVLATWMPAIYTSQWFQSNQWVRTHLLQTSTAHKKP